MKDEGTPEHVSKFHQLIGRAMVDTRFRERLTNKDPNERAAALRDAGFDATQEEMDALEKAVGSINELAYEFGDIQAAT